MHHPAYHFGALALGHILCPRNIGCAWSRRTDWLARYARQGSAYKISPRRIGWSITEKRAPFLRGSIPIAVLLIGKTEKITRLGIVQVARRGALKCKLCLIGDNAIGGSHERFTEIGFTRRAVAVERDRLLVCHHRIGKAAELQIDRSDYLPAGAVVRIAREMILDLADQAGN